MVATPLLVILHDRLRPVPTLSTDGVDAAEDLTGDVLIIGFGRVGQVVSQPLLARGFGISIIDNDVEMIEAAEEFGFKVYYGDGARLDILHATGAADASLVAVCVDRQEAATRIVELLKAEFPLTRILVRSFDRQHAVELVQLGAEYQVRETFESAMLMGRKALTLLGVEPEEAAEIMDAARRRDADRFQVDLVEGVRGGTTTGLLLGNMPDRPA
jgi:voltage-gated potassium channel Kch